MMVASKEKIIIVDDEVIILSAYKKELEMSGDYEVFTASSGEEALSIINKTHPSIAYIDLIMPGMGGVELCKSIKSISPETEVISMSGHPDEILKSQVPLVKSGGNPKMLRKPLGDDELSQTTKDVLNQKNKSSVTNKKILVIDDVQIVCDAFKKELADKEYDVDYALNGDDAVKKVEKEHYDLIFVDIVMPVMDGIATCRAIRKVDSKSILVFMTGKYDADSTRREIEFTQAGGENYYLYKPFTNGEILDVTKKILS